MKIIIVSLSWIPVLILNLESQVGCFSIKK